VWAKIRIECIVRSSTRALRDRRLNSLYRRIIANENIGCAGITNGRGADEMHDRRATFRPISSAKNILRMYFLLCVSKRACTPDNINNRRSIYALLLFVFFVTKFHLSNWMNSNITGFKHIKILKPSCFAKFINILTSCRYYKVSAKVNFIRNKIHRFFNRIILDKSDTNTV
jgi:hypothetical protein